MASNGLGGSSSEPNVATVPSSQQLNVAGRHQQTRPASSVAQIEAWAWERAAQPGSRPGNSRPQKSRRPQQDCQPQEPSRSAEDSSASDDTTSTSAAATDRGNGGAAEQGAYGHVHLTDPLEARNRVRFAAQQHEPRSRVRFAAQPHHHADPHQHLHPHGQMLQPQSQQQQSQRHSGGSLQVQLQQAQRMYRQRQQQLQEGQPAQQPALSASAPEFRPGDATAGSPAGAAAASPCGSSGKLEAEACVICCEPAEAIAVGSCQHPDAPICARCCLRQRLCYQVNKCPLCNAAQEEVAIGRWRPGGMPSLAEYEDRRHLLWQQPKWARGVLVDDSEPVLAARRAPLHVELQRMTGCACPVCDAAGQAKPFPSTKELRTHVERVHRKQLCVTCVHARRNFVTELPLYSATEMAEHQKGHPRCKYCKQHYYSADELFAHMRARHFGCEVCQRRDGAFHYFRDAEGLTEHLRADHFLCEEEDCQNAFMAYSTEAELAQHRRDRHSRVMPRFNRDAARRVDIDFGFGSRGRGPPAAGAPQRQQQQHQSLQQRPAVAEQQPRPSQASEGFALIDDDVGLAEDAFPDLPLSQRPAQAAGLSHWEAQRLSAQASQADEAFPSLSGSDGGGGPAPPATAAQHPGGRFRSRGASQPSSGAPAQRPRTHEQMLARQFFPGEFDDESEAAAPSAAPAAVALAARQPAAAARAQPKPLVRQTVKCPCGRRSSHQVVEQGATAPPPACDAACEREQRRSRLADAFGVDNPEQYTAVHERNRIPLYADSLLLAARKHPNFLSGVERHLAAFLAEPAAKRYALPPMPREERKLVHELAEHYGLTMQSLGQEPQRHIELFKTPRSSIPGRQELLSEAIAVLDAEQLGRMEQEAAGYPLRLLDVVRGCDVGAFLSRWEGSFKLHPQPGAGACIVRFTSAGALQEALQQLGGGVRGKFRVDPDAIRAYAKLQRPPATAGQAPSAASGARPYASGGAPSLPAAQSAHPARPVAAPAQAQQAMPKRPRPPYRPPMPQMRVQGSADPWDDLQDMHRA